MPRDYYDAVPDEGPDWDAAMDACCGECEHRTKWCVAEPQRCRFLTGWLADRGDEAEAQREAAEESAAERRREG